VPSGLTFFSYTPHRKFAAADEKRVAAVLRRGKAMLPTILPAVSIVAPDHVRLKRLALSALDDQHPVAEPLLAELHRATICAKPRRDVVALNRTVTYRSDLGWKPECRLLVCPEDYRDPSAHLSVLSPLGVALLGLRVGERFPYRTIDGLFHIAIVEDVDEPYWDGPEAA
jgi:transcription elongation GreA/GreB family factor